MAKLPKTYSGRSGSSAKDYGDGKGKSGGLERNKRNKTAAVGEKTTVRSGKASSKTYLTPLIRNGEQYYLSNERAKKK